MLENAIYKFDFDFSDGYFNPLQGIFVAPKRYINKLINDKILLHFQDYFPDNWDEPWEFIDNNSITMVTDDPEQIKSFIDHDMEFGYNPLDIPRHLESSPYRDSVPVREYLKSIMENENENNKSEG